MDGETLECAGRQGRVKKEGRGAARVSAFPAAGRRRQGSTIRVERVVLLKMTHTLVVLVLQSWRVTPAVASDAARVTTDVVTVATAKQTRQAADMPAEGGS